MMLTCSLTSGLLGNREGQCVQRQAEPQQTPALLSDPVSMKCYYPSFSATQPWDAEESDTTSEVSLLQKHSNRMKWMLWRLENEIKRIKDVTPVRSQWDGMRSIRTVNVIIWCSEADGHTDRPEHHHSTYTTVRTFGIIQIYLLLTNAVFI